MRWARMSGCVFIALLLPAPIVASQLSPRDVERLLEGVHEIAAPGVPGQLAVFGDSAAVLVVGADRHLHVPVVAAATWDNGKVLAFGHDGYFRKDALETAGTGRLLLNAIAWCGKGRVGVLVHERELYAFLVSRGVPAELLTIQDFPAAFRRYRVLCFRPSDVPDELLPSMAQFARKGGGLIVAETGWGWLQLNPGKTLHQSRANRLLHPAGIVWTDGLAARTSPAGFWAGRGVYPTCHAKKALFMLFGSELAGVGSVPGETDLPQPLSSSTGPSDLLRQQAVYSLQQACRFVPAENETFWKPLRNFVQVDKQPVPTLRTPVTQHMEQERLKIILFTEISKVLPPEEIPIHPAAADFPGLVPASVPRRQKTVTFDPRRPGWQSTGCYVPPGEVVGVRVLGDFRPGQIVIQIGCHSDTLWHLDTWRRMPELVRRIPIGKEFMRLSSPFGGLLYVEFVDSPNGGNVQLTFDGVVDAPYFVYGKTRSEDWHNLLKQPVPWAELESEKIVLTLPTEAARLIRDPAQQLSFWNRVLDACAELAGREVARERPERIVTDRQISAGYMHAGYPIMTHLDVAELLAQPDREHSDPRWGIFHELGHNHQSPDWTFPEVGEVTCNLFTIHVLETVCGMKDRSAMHPGLAGREKRIADYFASPPSLDRLARDPFLGLIPYLQLQEAFGWEAYRRVFAEYRLLPSQQRPRTNQEKIDQWVVRFSKAVGRNLAPFHRSWGFPVSEKAEKEIEHLPRWMPEGFPPPAIETGQFGKTP